MPRQANREGDFSFEIIRHLGVYGHSAKGWTREANIVEWNGGNAKFDLREWDPEHTRMSRGIMLQKQATMTNVQIMFGERFILAGSGTMHDNQINSSHALGRY